MRQSHRATPRLYSELTLRIRSTFGMQASMRTSLSWGRVPSLRHDSSFRSFRMFGEKWCQPSCRQDGGTQTHENGAALRLS